MRIFIDFWKLETENSVLHIFSFLHKLSFENSFCFLFILGCQTSFKVSKIKKKLFLKTEIREKNSYQTYPKVLKRAAFFLWTTVHGQILDLDNLMLRGHSLANRCYTCRCNGEFVDHLLLHCLVVHIHKKK